MAVDPASRLVTLADRMAPRFRQRFLALVEAIKTQSTLSELAALIEAGRIGDALVAAESAVISMSNVWGEVFVLSGEETARVVSGALNFDVLFDRVNQRGVNAMQRNQLRLVREFMRQQREATRQALIDGVTRGLNPRQQARLFRDSIGLTARQEQAVRNFRRLLESNSAEALTRKLRDRRFDRAIQSAIKAGEPLSPERIDRMVTRYRERYLKFRSETIARTESLAAVHEGNHEMYRQAIDRGDLDADSLIQTWDTSQDERVRDFKDSNTSHRTMHGQKRKIGETFESGAGNQLRFPGDANAPGEDRVECRCAVTTRFKASAKRAAA